MNQRTSLPGQRGEGRIGFFIALTVFAVGVFLAVKVVPVRVNAYQFRESLREEARYASVHKNDKKVAARILEKAAGLDVPLDAKNLTIRRTKSEVIINAKYEQAIDLKLTTYTYRFDHEQRAPLF